MNQQFLTIKLNSSIQSPSCITLENWIDELTNPDFRENLQQCQNEIEMINQFPIVGYGLQIKFKQQQENNKKGIDIKVKTISQVEKIIDWTTIQLDKQILTRDKPNCIIPLLKKEEQNGELLRSEIFKRKISYLITKNHQLYNQNSYILLLQSTLKYLIKINNNLEWQQEMLKEIFEVSEQVFIGTNIYNRSIKNDEFQNSEFQLLNVFCLHLQKCIEPEDIYNEFIKPKIKKFGSFQLNDQGQNGLGKFFDSLDLNQEKINFEDINGYIIKYLEGNDYFYSSLFYGKYITKLIEYFIPNEIAKQKLKEDLFFKEQETFEENQYQKQKQLIINFAQSTIYKFLFNKLFDNYEEEKKNKLFQSFNQAIEIGNYYSFLQHYSKFEDLVQYYNLNTKLSDEHSYQNGITLFIQYLIQQLIKSVSIIELKKRVYNNWEEVRQSQEILKQQAKLQKYMNIFGIKQNIAQQVENEILNTISEICWLNCQALKIDYQNDSDIINYLIMIKDFPQNQNFKTNFNLHQKYLFEVTQFCFKLKNQTQVYKYFQQFETIELNKILPKDPKKANNVLKIYQISKSLIKISET